MNTRVIKGFSCDESSSYVRLLIQKIFVQAIEVENIEKKQ